jgi:carbon storage regulator
MMIGDDIKIEVVLIKGRKVKLGFTMPKSISCHRDEVWHAIQREKAAAGKDGAK